MPNPIASEPLRRRSLMHCFALPLGLAITLLVSACTMKTDSFDSETWKAQKGVKALDNKRGGMTSAFKSVIQPGMPRAEVIRLLGEPDARHEQTDTDVYELGVSGYGIDEEYYEIRYQGGNVLSYRFMRR
ncbi:MAG: hypothetical protein KDF54_12875 [Hydrogenophaga sp.]|nr:hypothetical protein [Hydrogenophaga sp.]